LGAVEERSPVGLCGEAFATVNALPEGVRLALPLRVEGENDVPGLGESLSRVPVELLVRLHRAVGDHDAGPLGGARLGGPDVAGQRRAVASGEEHRLDDAVALRLPVVEPGIARAAVAAGPAKV